MTELNGWVIDRAFTDLYGGDYCWESLPYCLERNGDQINIDGKAYTVEFVEHRDSDEEYTSQMHTIFKLDGVAYKKRGYYQSHYGSEWDGAITRVNPKTITVTEWEDV